MKRLLLSVFLLLANAVFAFQDSIATMPAEQTRPVSHWWWVIGVIVTIGLGMLVYVLIKKDPRRDG